MRAFVIKNMAALIFRLNMNIREHISVNYFKSQSEQKTPTAKILREVTQTNLFFHKPFNKLENKIKTSLQVNHDLLNVTVPQLRSSDVHWPFLVYVAYRECLRRKFYFMAKNENVRYDDSNETLRNVFSVS